MIRHLRIAGSVIFGLLTVAAMVAGGIGAVVAASATLMSLGLKYHDNYEYYGSTRYVFFVYLAGAIGFATPGLVAWWHFKDRLTWRLPRFSLRTLLIATTLVAVVLGLAVWAGR